MNHLLPYLMLLALLAPLALGFSAEHGEISDHLSDNSTDSALHARACTQDLYWPTFELTAVVGNPLVNGQPTGPSPAASTSTNNCNSICQGYHAWKRKRSTGECWCLSQPFGGGYVVSGKINGNFDTGFYPNTSPTPLCAMYVNTNQKAVFNGGGTLGPYTKTTDNACALACGNPLNTQRIWTRYRTTNQCYCGNLVGPFILEALQYDPNASFGINAKI